MPLIVLKTQTTDQKGLLTFGIVLQGLSHYNTCVYFVTYYKHTLHLLMSIGTNKNSLSWRNNCFSLTRVCFPCSFPGGPCAVFSLPLLKSSVFAPESFVFLSSIIFLSLALIIHLFLSKIACWLLLHCSYHYCTYKLGFIPCPRWTNSTMYEWKTSPGFFSSVVSMSNSGFDKFGHRD